jgi:uncharacterized protein (TIGR04255 family)
LELVVCQVRHDDRAVSGAAALQIQEELGGPAGHFPRIEQVEMQTATIAVGSGAVVPGPSDISRGWHLKSADGSWTAALLPGHFSLETTRYTTWNDFRGLFGDLCRAVERAVPPTIEQRVGLRYVDRISGLNASAPRHWERWIHHDILGPPLHAMLGRSVLATRQQIDLDLGEGRACILRHGAVGDPTAPPGKTNVYLLDFDIYREQARRFASGDVLAATQGFHELADALFVQVITPDLLRYLSNDDNV